MILNKRGHKRTANELAKELVRDHGASVCNGDWERVLPDVYLEKLTDKEEDALETAIFRQVARVEKLLGALDSDHNKEDG